METLIKPQRRVQVDDDEIDAKVETIERRAVVVPRRVGDWARHEGGADPEAGAEREEKGYGDEGTNLRAKTTGAEHFGGVEADICRGIGGISRPSVGK